jgi:DNA (cytosine-5)-methyltransferase 1
MIYGSVCSGIEAASVAWEPLGWQPAWFSEIEKFPSAVLAQRWPHVPNLGDMTQLAAAVRRGIIAPDILVGGTPCQAFSIAGLRNGLSDARGQLTLSYVELANAIDDKRRERNEPAAILVWENVPGVLSSKDNSFGCFLAGLAGESCALESPGGKWNNAGYVLGPQRAIAWRVLDAQFFGVAQRRRRVFVVASAREGFDPAAVLFEFESLRRDTPPRREPQTAVAALTANGVGTCGADDNQGQAGHLIAECVSGKISHTLKADGFDGSEDGTGRGTPVIAFGGGNTSGNIDVAACLTAKGQRIDFDVETFAIAFAENSQNQVRLQNGDGLITGPLSTGGGKPGQGYPAIAYEPYTLAIRGRAEGSSVEVRSDGTANALLTPNGGRAGMGVGAIGWGMQVRRLTPRECERLQGFPDDHTLIEYGRKISPEKMDRDFAKYLMRGGKLTFEECCGRAADGPRYKAIGNSMAVPVMRWIGARIDKVLKTSPINKKENS